MIPTTLALSAEHATDAVHSLVERRPELRTVTVGDHGLRAVDVDDDFDPLRVLLLTEDDLGRGGPLFVLGKRLDLVLGPLQYVAGDIAVSFGDLDSDDRASPKNRGQPARECIRRRKS